MTNPYQTPQSNIELPPEPDTPKLISWAYVLVGLNLFFVQLDTILMLLNDEMIAGNFWAFGGLTILNVVIAWWVYQGIKQRNRHAWLLPALLLLLTMVSLVSEFSRTDSLWLIVYLAQVITLAGIVVILFTSTGKAWRSDEDDGMLS